MHLTPVSIVIPSHGTYAVDDALAIDIAITRYLPASPARLRVIVEERTGFDWSDVSTATEFVIVLAALDSSMRTSICEQLGIETDKLSITTSEEA